MPYHRARDWVRELASDPRTLVRGMYMAFTESDFDAEQLNRFDGLISDAREDAIDLGRLHAASSNGVFHLPEAHLDMVRPGIALYGSYPSRPDEERAMSELRPACRLKARVVRVARLRPGDSVSYGRSYVAERAVWTATIPAGHTDGVTRNAVDGARVLIGERTYPVIGARIRKPLHRRDRRGGERGRGFTCSGWRRRDPCWGLTTRTLTPTSSPASPRPLYTTGSCT